MNSKLYDLNLRKINRPLNFGTGDTVRVYYKIKETNKTRIQVFEGLVIAIKNKLQGKSFTVRRISFNIPVERIFPLYSPHIENIVVISSAKVRRSKLYYIREKFGKKGKLKEVKKKKIYHDHLYEKAVELQDKKQIDKSSENQNIESNTPSEDIETKE